MPDRVKRNDVTRASVVGSLSERRSTRRMIGLVLATREHLIERGPGWRSDYERAWAEALGEPAGGMTFWKQSILVARIFAWESTHLGG